jgi:hypothetical protein
MKTKTVSGDGTRKENAPSGIVRINNNATKNKATKTSEIGFAKTVPIEAKKKIKPCICGYFMFRPVRAKQLPHSINVQKSTAQL